MASLNLYNAASVLPCPACGQTINTSMTSCPFCATPLDSAAATLAAETFARVNQSISDASYLKIMAATAVTFFLLQLAPIVGMVGFFGFYFLEFAIPFMSIRWWAKYRSLPSRDPDYLRARRLVLLIGIGSILFLIVVRVVIPLLR